MKQKVKVGYHVTIIKDAIAAFSHKGMHSVNEVNGPAFAHTIFNTKELPRLLPEEQK